MERPADEACLAWDKCPCGKACLRQSEKGVAKRPEPLPRKAAIAHAGPVPQTDTGGWGEDPKAGGRSIAKELGKTAP